MSLIRKIMRICHLESYNSSDKIIILESKNPRDIKPEETQELAESIRTLNFGYKVEFVSSEQRGYGVTWYEVLYIWLPGALIAGGAIAVKQIIQEVAKIAVQWARERVKKKATSKRPTYIAIYGPDGKVLKSILVKDAVQEAEDRTEQDQEEQRKVTILKKPPLLGE
jgi:hypothetical protein